LRKKFSYPFVFFTLLFLIFTFSSNSFPLDFQPARIKKIDFKPLKGRTRISIVSDKPISYYETSEFEEPFTLIISIPEAELSFTDERYLTMPIDTANVKEIRLHQFYDYLAHPPKILRIIVEFNEKPRYRIDLIKKNSVMNIEVETPRVMLAEERKEKLISDAFKKAEERELKEKLEEEKRERILAEEAQRIKEEAKRKELKKVVKVEEVPKEKPEEMIEIPEEKREVRPKKKGWFESWKEKRERERKKKLEAKKEKELEESLKKIRLEEEAKEYRLSREQEYLKLDELMRFQKMIAQKEVKEKPKEEVPKPAIKEKPKPKKEIVKEKIEEPKPITQEEEKLPAKAIEKPPSVEELVRKGEEERKIVGAPSAPTKEEKKPKKKITVLQECIDIGLENHLPAKIALDEVKLAELKLTEAKRTLFPSASYKIVKTNGDIYDIDFTEEEYTLRMEQPIYYGGRLRDAVRKAELSLETAKRNYNKLKVDFIARVEATFYNFVGAQMTLAAQEELKAEAEHILGIAKRRYDSGLSTEVEYLNLQNLYASILYQINVAQMEMGSAKIQLEHELNLDTSSYEIEVKEPLLYAKIDIDLEKSVQFAYENRPELFINELTVRVKELEEKITRNKNRFKIDFTGSYGKGGGAYKTEELNLGDTWYAGIMFSKPIGGNTISYNLNKDETAPRLGQSTRTGSQSQIWEFNLLNNIVRYSEEKNAQIDLKKAINELNETKKSISTEVREAFFRYEKAIMQVDGSVIKIQLRQKEIEVSQANVDVDQAFLSELLESKMKLTDEKVSYINSVSNYFTAISGINKSIGLSEFYNVETPPPAETKVAKEEKTK